MNIESHYHRSYVEGEEIELKCKFISKTDGVYNAIGIRRETVDLVISDDLKNSVQIENGLWYKIDGTILSKDGYNLKLDVDSIEGIGESVNDWIYEARYPSFESSKNNSRGPQWRSFNSQDSQRVGSSTTTSMHDTGLTTSVSWNGEATEDMSGFATGGGKNIKNFRQNIDRNILPHEDSISHEGLLYQYEFDIGSGNKNALFYPNYEQAVIKDPISNKEERYMTVGLDSGLESFDRPPLDLMFVIDVSGSMSSRMDSYYYDNQNEEKRDIEQKTKIDATKEVLKNVIKKLNEEDRFGITLYNQDGFMAKPLRYVKDSNIDEIDLEIDKLDSDGGTNLSEGFSTAVKEMTEFSDIETDDLERESRVMFMTDAMPNTGKTSKSEIEKDFKNAAEKGIHTTFIGIGIDTNPELIDTLSSIRGGNHYFVQSVEEFNEKIKDEFSYTVTPLVFDLKLTVEGQGFDIDGVYGSPNEDSESTGAVMEVKTLFPSHGDEGTKGGVIVVSTKDADIGDKVRISTSWVERDGTKDGDVTKVKIKDEKPTYYESEDTMKAILLCKYVNIVSDYLNKVNSNGSNSFERKSQNIVLPDQHRESISNFARYFENKIDESNNELEKELDDLKKILKNE